MDGEALSEREHIRREIAALRRGIHLHLSANDGDTANRLRDQISDLERQIDHSNKPEREAREERGQQ
jgi:protein-arginine kinase activator protein McsA